MCVGRASILATATDTDSAEEIASAFCTEPPIPGLLPKSDLVTASENCPLASLSDREMIPHFSTEKMLCGKTLCAVPGVRWSLPHQQTVPYSEISLLRDEASHLWTKLNPYVDGRLT